jgi:hypothetical protein
MKSSGATSGPLWILDIRRLGYTPPQHGRDVGQEKPLGVEPICFLADGQVVVTFVTREAPTALSRRGQTDETSAFRLHALFIDAGTGTFRTAREWPTPSTRSRVLATTGGKFVVLTPDQLLLYSPNFEFLGRLDLPLSREAIKDNWEVHRSPGGKYLLLSYEPEVQEKAVAGLPLSVYLSHLKDVKVNLEWIRLDDLQLLDSWTTTLGADYPASISDSGMSLANAPSNSPPKIGGLAKGPWHEFCPYYQAYCRSGGFINNEAILSLEFNKGPEAIWVVSTSGELLFHEIFREKEILSTLGWHASADGQRFAFAVMKIKGENKLLDIGGHAILDRVMIFDIPGRRWIYTLDAKKQKVTTISGYALSPDGSLLGLITQDGVLQVYRAPDLPAPPH